MDKPPDTMEPERNPERPPQAKLPRKVSGLLKTDRRVAASPPNIGTTTMETSKRINKSGLMKTKRTTISKRVVVTLNPVIELTIILFFLITARFALRLIIIAFRSPWVPVICPSNPAIKDIALVTNKMPIAGINQVINERKREFSNNAGF